MKHYLDCIAKIITNGGQVICYENLITNFALNEKSTKEEIQKCNLYFNNKLPKDYEYFLNNYNGGSLFNYENISGLELFSTNELITVNKNHIENCKQNEYEEYIDYNVIFFATDIGGDAEYLGFKIKENGKYEVLDITLYEKPSEWRIIDNSFDSFMENFIQERGKPYWLL